VTHRPATADILGYPLAVVDLDEAARWMLDTALSGGDRASPESTEAPGLTGEGDESARSEGRLVVTLNPEIVVRAEADPRLREAVGRADIIVADGIGLLWAAARHGVRLPGRVSGIDLVCRVMELGAGALRVYFLGGKPGVAERAAATAKQRWGVVIAGCHHGYFTEREEAAVVAAVGQARAHVLLAGLGEGQEMFLDRHRGALGAAVLIGVGGTLDVLAGEASRTPTWTRRLNLEWAWRVGLDRRRWHRFPRLVSFVRLVLKRSGRRAPG
jgi:N-acetylglucosaminyldiphosphoundecaprenol N-acetyl-beta-D-mannosaminyltransferase